MNDDMAHVNDDAQCTESGHALAQSVAPAAPTAFQQDRLRSMLGHAISNSPYYREAIGDRGDRDIALRDLPILTKRTLMEEFDRILCSRRLDLDLLERHQKGVNAAEPLFDKFRIFSSSARTGQRAFAVYDRNAWDLTVSGMRRALGMLGISEDTRIIAVGSPAELNLINGLMHALRGRYIIGPPLTVATPLNEMVAALNEFQPQVVITFPSFIQPLADEQAAERLRIRPLMFCSMAEPLTQEVRDLAHRTWGALVLNIYAATEVGLIAVECPFTQGLHVAEDLLLVENVDANNRPVPAGLAGHKVLITTLFNRTMPLIRYELPDLVTVATSPCACGRSGLRLAHVAGCREDAQLLPARNGGRVPVHTLHLHAPLMRIPEVRHFQITAHRGALTVRVTLKKASSNGRALTLVRKAVLLEIDRVGAAIERLTIEAVDEAPKFSVRPRKKLVRVG